MARFRFLALDGAGTETEGFLEGPDAGWVSDRLASEELVPLEIEEAHEKTDALEALRGLLPVTVEDLSLFSSQFALMLDTGLPILAALELLSENTNKPRLREALLQTAEQIRQGGSLAESLAGTGQFPDIYLNMVRAGEAGGTLVEVLQQLASYLDREAELRGRLKGALTYPAFLVVLSVCVVTFLMVAIIPRFTKVLVDMNIPLPAPTRVLMAISAFLVAHWPWLLVGMAACGAGTVLLLRDERVRLRLDGLALALPLFGELVTKNSLARMSFVLGSLLAGGIPIVDALEVAGGTAGNRQVRRGLADARRRIIGGSSVAEALARSGSMPSLVLQMVSIGEATGSLDRVLLRVSELYDLQVARVTNALVRLVEPAMIVVLGGIVGFIALSLVLPMVKAVASFGG